MLKFKKGDKTKFTDYLDNPIYIGDMVVYVPFKKARSTELITGTIIRATPLKLVVRRLGNSKEEFVYDKAMVNIKNLNKWQT